MQVQVLRIEIWAGQGEGFEARGHVPNSGDFGPIRFDPPYSEAEAEGVMEHLKGLQRRSGELAWKVEKLEGDALATTEEKKSLQRSSRQANAELLRYQKEVGQKLMGSLWSGELGIEVSRCLHYGDSEGDEEFLRIELVFDPKNERVLYLAGLPWELLYRADQEDFLGTSRKITITRYLESRRGFARQRVDGPLRVLVIQSNPKDLRWIDPDTEREEILDTLGMMDSERVEIEAVSNVSISQLSERLNDRKNPVHIVHFIGHGGFEDGNGYLGFVDERTGDSQQVSGRSLGEVVKNSSVRLVVLSTCRGAEFHRRKAVFPFIGVAPAVLRAGVPAVVAMQTVISDAAAAQFTSGFYHSLAQYKAVDQAVAQGRKLVRIEERTVGEWATPTLFLRVADGGNLFFPAEGTRATARGLAGTREAAEPAEAPPIQMGIRSGFRKGEQDNAQGLKGRTWPKFLDLTEHFDNWLIRRQEDWHGVVFPRLVRFTRDIMKRFPKRRIELEIAAHHSLAFATGYLMEAKSGHNIAIVQSTTKGPILFRQDEPELTEEVWRVDEERLLDEKARDVALAVSITWSVLSHVEAFVQDSGLPIRRIVPVSVAPQPGPLSVKGGAHAVALAHQLALLIRERSREETEGTLHLFISAPNAVLFFLGQLARGFGKVQLYEHKYPSDKVGDYRKSLLLSSSLLAGDEVSPADETAGPPKPDLQRVW